MSTKLVPIKPLGQRSARWPRLSLRLLGVAAWLLLVCLCLMATACRTPTPAPTATVVPVPTFTATPVQPTPIQLARAEPTLSSPPASPPPPPNQPPPRPPVTLSLPIQLPAPLYYLNETGQVWRVVGAPPEYSLEQVTQEAAPITDFAISPVHGRLAYVTNEYRDLIEFDPATGQRVVKLAKLDRTPPPNGIDLHTKLRARAIPPMARSSVLPIRGSFCLPVASIPAPSRPCCTPITIHWMLKAK